MGIIYIILLCNTSGGIVRAIGSCSRHIIFSAAFRCPAGVPILHHVCCTTIIIETHIITEVLGFYTYTYMHYKHTECVLSTAAISGYSAIILVYHFPINMCARLCVCVCELYPFIVDAVFTWGFNAVGRKNIYIILSILYACGCTIQMVIEG